MNWPDEKYVKVYTRDTLTWKSWCWQARTVFSLLVRKLDGAGLIETGRMDPVDALALQLDLPREVVAAGLPPIIDCGTAEMVPGGLLVPKWIEAQESTKTEAQKKRDQRSRVRDQRRIAQVSEIRQAPVPECPALSPAVPLQPSPAQPSPTTSPEKIAGELLPAPGILQPLFASEVPVVNEPRYGKPKTPPKSRVTPPDPRHAPLVKALMEASPGYAFRGRDAGAVTDLLALADAIKAPPREAVTRWQRALRRNDFPKVRTLSELVTHWEHFATDAPAPRLKVANGPIEPTHTHGVGDLTHEL